MSGSRRAAEHAATGEGAGPVRVLFVCLGNICRSPAAEGAFRRIVDRAGLAGLVEIDSAGTGAWHVGQPPDRRTQASALRKGVDLSAQRARQVRRSDLLGDEAFDLVVAMDSSNFEHLREMAGAHAVGRLRLLLRDYAPDAGRTDVPDPYHAGPGDTEGFDLVFDLVERGCEGLLLEVQRMLAARR